LRRLIINADDFGLTPGVNRGILEAHGHGVVTSTTLMATGPAFAEAARAAQSAPRLSVGCHVMLVDGLPVLDVQQIRSLLDPHNPTRLQHSLARFASRTVRGRLAEEEIEAEAIAQIRRLQSAGIAVSHLDTHKHTHIFPQVLRPLLRAAKACEVPALRNPFERVRLGHGGARPALWKRGLQVLSLRSLAPKFWQAVGEAGLQTTDGAMGIVATGSFDDALFRALLQDLPEGTWELVCHPGYDDSHLQETGTRLRESRRQELQLLTSGSTHAWLASQGIQLISYRDLGRIDAL
jgi:predicted glycoside hydrolase/deacetylase ChbG (UPF0249 family)